MRHRAHPLAFISGLLFLVAGFLFLLDRLALITVDRRFVLPAVLIAAGVWVLLGGGRDEPPARPPPPEDTP
jgi:hypothetical protein